MYYAFTLAFHSVHVSNALLHPRLAIIAAVVAVWGLRLTFNFWRKGGYALSGEDYRWKHIQQGVNPILFQTFNLVFIAVIQNILLAALLSPVYVAWSAGHDAKGRLSAPLNEIDGVATALAVFFIIFETVADQQQWAFQTAKQATVASRKRLTGDLAKGFIDTGLFKYSRHPNFFAEQAFWWTLNLYATAATGQWTGWWVGGAAALTALFQGSTWLTENISAKKYPLYARYQETTSRLLPWFPSSSSASGGSGAGAQKKGGSSAAGADAGPSTSTRRRTPSAKAVAALEIEKEIEAVEDEEFVVLATLPTTATTTTTTGRGRSTIRRSSATTTTTEKPKPLSRSRSASSTKKKTATKKVAAAAAPASKSKSPTKATRATAKTKKAPTAADSGAAKKAAPRRSSRSKTA